MLVITAIMVSFGCFMQFWKNIIIRVFFCKSLKTNVQERHSGNSEFCLTGVILRHPSYFPRQNYCSATTRVNIDVYTLLLSFGKKMCYLIYVFWVGERVRKYGSCFDDSARMGILFKQEGGCLTLRTPLKRYTYPF